MHPHQSAPLEIELQGMAVSPGIAIGRAFPFKHIDLDALRRTQIPIETAEVELDRLARAVHESFNQLSGLQNKSRQRGGGELFDIFGAHITLLNDEAFLGRIRHSVRAQNTNVEFILANAIAELEAKFAAIESEAIRSAYTDIQDVYHRLLRNLLNIEHVHVNPLARIEAAVILVAETLMPSDIAIVEQQNIAGLCIKKGNIASHVAIMARSLSIPTVMNVSFTGLTNIHGTVLIIDGNNGKVICNPNRRHVNLYERKRGEPGPANAAVKPKHCATTDGTRIRLEANANSVQDVNEAFAWGAEGIGLLRSEFFLLSRPRLPAEEEERSFYAGVAAACKKRPLTIRLLDLGADKMPTYFSAPATANPQLGVRGIRYLLKHPALMRRHLMALLQVARTSSINLLIPFVASVADLKRTDEIITALCAEVGVSRAALSIGIMIEVPSAALLLDAFIDKVDFLSIGTNDLMQYLCAADREAEGLDEYRSATLPVMLRLIKQIAQTAARHGKPLSICGEMTADVHIASLLVGLGCRSLSMHAASIAAVRKALAAVSIDTLARRAELFIRRHE
jgi:phosphotransferase system enzyme I (PtsI)